MEEQLKAGERAKAAVDVALTIQKIANDLIASQTAVIREQRERILELELERATLLVVLQRLRDGRAEGLKQ